MDVHGGESEEEEVMGEGVGESEMEEVAPKRGWRKDKAVLCRNPHTKNQFDTSRRCVSVSQPGTV